MIVTNSKQIAQFARTIRNHGITKSLKQRFSGGKPWNYDVIEPGYNYRLDEIRAVLGISQLQRLDKLNFLRERAYKYYNSKLKNIPGITLPYFSDKGDHSFHLYIIQVHKQYGTTRDKLFEKLQEKGIRSSVHYKPVHKFTIFKKYAKIYDVLTNSNELYTQILSLPFYPDISRNEQDYVIKNIKLH